MYSLLERIRMGAGRWVVCVTILYASRSHVQWVRVVLHAHAARTCYASLCQAKHHTYAAPCSHAPAHGSYIKCPCYGAAGGPVIVALSSGDTYSSWPYGAALSNRTDTCSVSQRRTRVRLLSCVLEYIYIGMLVQLAFRSTGVTGQYFNIRGKDRHM